MVEEADGERRAWKVPADELLRTTATSTARTPTPSPNRAPAPGALVQSILEKERKITPPSPTSVSY